MTLENLLSQIGTPTKHIVDRYSEYSAPVHEHDVYYGYESSALAHGHNGISKHNYGNGHKNSASMSALTLLAFLFFLHILQQCIKDHMTDMNSVQPVVVMTAGRETDEIISKSVINKIDKTGITQNMEAKFQNDIKTGKQYKIINTKKDDGQYDSLNKKERLRIHTNV